MANVVHAVMLMDGDRVVASHFGVPTDDVLNVVENLRAGHGPPQCACFSHRRLRRLPHGPATALRAVPLPIRCADREDEDDGWRAIVNPCSEGAEPACLIVLDRLDDLLAAVHHEGAVGDDRLAKGRGMAEEYECAVSR